MRFLPRSTALLASLVFLLAALPQIAAAQASSVYVLGIRSLEGDDEFARELTGAIRVASSRIPGWEVAPDEVSLSQMTMMHGCAEPNVACMTAIAQELGADKVIYATVRRSGGTNYNFALSLYLFTDGSIAQQLTDTIPQGETNIDALRVRADRYAAQLGGQARYGSLRLDVGEANARVSVDGQPAGVTNAAGTILIEDLTEGEHDIDVEADGFPTFSTSVEIEADGQREVRANLAAPPAGDGPNLGWIPGAALIGGGVVSLVFAAVASGKVGGWNSDVDAVRDNPGQYTDCVNAQFDDLTNNETITCMDGAVLNRTQTLVLRTDETVDACEAPPPGWPTDLCDNHRRQVRVQYALYGLGIVSIGVGTFLLLRALGGDDDEGETTGVNVDVSPWMAGRDGGMNMTMTW